MNPPPDIDKVDYAFGNSQSCWVAAGSNLLGGAGYGDGNNVQERADDIYRELCGTLVDCNKCGWDDTAITKWLQSDYNKWKNTNPYTVVNAHGNRDTRPPWARTDLPMLIGNNLRQCSMLSLSIRKPTCDTNTGKGGHSVACWGDSGEDANYIDSNPAKVKITDSDFWDSTKILQTYTYDDYNNPNPGDKDDCNEGPGWYFDYWQSCHWYIDGFTTLEATKDGNNSNVRTLVTSAKFTYNGNDPCALDLHYKISSSKQILSYRTTIDWDTNHTPGFYEDTNYVSVSWDLNDNPVPKGSFITVTAEIVVPYDANGDSITMDSVWWTPMILKPIPGAGMWGHHHELAGGYDVYEPNMCGGYIICAAMIFGDQFGGMPVGEYRWQLKYDYYQNPELHELTFLPEMGTGTYYMGFFRFGHSYGLLMDDELQTFSDWKTIEYPTPSFPPLGPHTFVLNWAGQLPYPKGQDYIAPSPDYCGDEGTVYPDGDINKDCKVDWQDFAMFADSWLLCSDPNQANCQ
jgi:hypothetical protein